MKKYYKDYKLIPDVLPNGKIKHKIEYAGKYYICNLSSTELRKKKFYCLALILCSVIIMIGVGLIDTPGSRIFYVAVPYVGLFFPIVFNLMGAISFLASGNKLEHATYDKSINRIHRSSVGQLIISSITIAGDICYLFFGGNAQKIPNEIIFLGGMVIILIFSILLLRTRGWALYREEESA